MPRSFVILTPQISVNALYTSRRFLTSKGQNIKGQMAWEFKGQNKNCPLLECPLSLSIHFFFKDNRKDIDSCLKGLLDSMQGIVFLNDRQIVRLNVLKEITKGHEKTLVEVSEI